VGLAHAHFVGQVGDPMLPEDVVDRDSATELLLSALPSTDPLSQVEQAACGFEIDHDASSVLNATARSRNQRSNQSRNPGISGPLSARADRRRAAPPKRASRFVNSPLFST